MNLFAGLPQGPVKDELCEALIKNEKILIERIISTGQSSPQGFWYDQQQEEWVALLQGNARLSWYDGTSVTMKAGDWLFIPAHEQHRVDETSIKPPCIWLAVHGKLT